MVKRKRSLRGLWKYNPYPKTNDPDTLRRISGMRWIKTNRKEKRLILSKEDIRDCLVDPESLTPEELTELFKDISYGIVDPQVIRKRTGFPPKKLTPTEVGVVLTQVEVVAAVKLDGFDRKPFTMENSEGELLEDLGRTSPWANLFDPRVFITTPSENYLSTWLHADTLEPERVHRGERYSLPSLATWYLRALQEDTSGFQELVDRVQGILKKFLPKELASRLN